jgi:hypothetical protein
MLKLILITVGMWLASVIFILFAIGFVAAVTQDVSAAKMGIPVYSLVAVVIFTIAADTFFLARMAQPLTEGGFRRFWIGTFLLGELVTAVLLMIVALLVLNR